MNSRFFAAVLAINILMSGSVFATTPDACALLLAKIHAAPADDEAREAYAAYLEQAGRGSEAKLIRLQLERDRLLLVGASPMSPRLFWQDLKQAGSAAPSLAENHLYSRATGHGTAVPHNDAWTMVPTMPTERLAEIDRELERLIPEVVKIWRRSDFGKAIRAAGGKIENASGGLPIVKISTEDLVEHQHTLRKLPITALQLTDDDRKLGRVLAGKARFDGWNIDTKKREDLIADAEAMHEIFSGLRFLSVQLYLTNRAGYNVEEFASYPALKNLVEIDARGHGIRRGAIDSILGEKSTLTSLRILRTGEYTGNPWD